MKLFADEDTGSGVPRALREVVRNLEIEYPRPNGPIPKGTPDTIWIPFAADRNYLIFSCNKHILDVEAEVSALVRHRAGAVFLDSGRETSQQVLTLLLNQWEWLEDIHSNHPRPFAYPISIKGRKTLVTLPTLAHEMDEPL